MIWNRGRQKRLEAFYQTNLYFFKAVVLNVGHCQGDTFKVPPESLQEAHSTEIDWAFKRVGPIRPNDIYDFTWKYYNLTK